MKTKLILIAALAVLSTAGAAWTVWHHAAAAPVDTRKALFYTCPMHPSVKADKPGDCSLCGMKLVPVYVDRAATPAPANADTCCGATCVMNPKP